MPRKSKDKKLSANANVFVPVTTFISPSTSSPPLKGFVRASATETSGSSPPTSSLDDSSISSPSNDATPAILERFRMTWPHNAPRALTSCHVMGPPKAECPLINTTYQIAHLIDTICALPLDPLGGEGLPNLFVDLEGTNLSRKGTVSLLQICVQPEQPLAFPQEKITRGAGRYGWAGEREGEGERNGGGMDGGLPSSRSNPYKEDSTVLPPPTSAYVLDIHHLGAAAFRTFGIKNSGTTLKDILESPLIPKVFFDVRNDSNALYWIYGVKLEAVHDLQCMEAATGSRGHIIGLGRCIKVLHGPEHKRRGDELFLQTALDDDEFRAVQTISQRGKFAFAPEHGGSYEVFKARPLSASMLAYAVSDVVLMPGIYARFREMMDRWGSEYGNMDGSGVGEYMWNVLNVSKHRVMLSQQEAYDSKGKAKTLNPWMTAGCHNFELRGRGIDFGHGVEWVYLPARRAMGVVRLRGEVAVVGGKGGMEEASSAAEAPAFSGQLEDVERGMRGGGLSPPRELW